MSDWDWEVRHGDLVATQSGGDKFTVGPYVHDRAGGLAPVWKMRARHRVLISDRSRLIEETRYSHNSREAQITLQAANLG